MKQKSNINPYMPNDELRLLKDAGAAITVSTPHLTINLGLESATIVHPQVVIYISAIDGVTGDEVYTFEFSQSSDNFVTEELIGTKVLKATSVVVANRFTKFPITFSPNAIEKDYVRLRTVPTGTTPSVTFKAYLSAAYS